MVGRKICREIVMINLAFDLPDLPLGPIAAVDGEVHLVGSKSLTNRALLLSALSQGRTTLTNILRSDDSKVMLEALRQLGVKVTADPADPTTVTIEGVGGPFVTAASPEAPIKLFLGNAGTAMRPLCAALALSCGTFELTGEPRMYERPIGILVDALRTLGAKVEYLGTEGYPPLRITGIGQPGVSAAVTAGTVGAAGQAPATVAVAGNTSSQFITALLMVGALLPNGLKLQVQGELISKPYVAMTCALLQRFGVSVVNHDFASFELVPQQLKSPGSYLVEGDASGATYFLAAAAIAGSVTVKGVGSGSLQGDAHFIDVLAQMGAHTEIGPDYLKVSQAPLKGIDLDLNDMPDAAMTLVPMALFTSGPIAIRNIGSWRVKETDRIAALACEMRKLGCAVEDGPDYIVVDGNTDACRQICSDLSRVIAFDTYNDHRMAMALSLVAFARPVIINDYRCCAKTFPDYFERFAALAQPRTE